MKELGPHGGPDDKAKVTFRTTLVAKLAAREVSQRGGGARRGSEAPELMSPQGEIQAERAERQLA